MTFDRPRAAVTIGGFCAFLDLYAPQAVLPQLARDFGISAAAAGSTVGISTLAVAGAAPFVGMLADRLGRKITIVAAVLLLTLPSIMLVLANGLDQILLWRFAQGLLLPAIFSPVVAYVSEAWPPDESADVMGLYVAGSALGGFSGRFITALMAEHFGWRSGFAVLTLVTVACGLAIWRWMPTDRRRLRSTAGGGFVALFGHLRNPALLATCVVGFAVLGSMVATFTYVNFHLAAPPYRLSTAQLGMIFLVYPIGAAAAPASGLLIRRLGRRRAVVLAMAVSGLGLTATLGTSLAAVIAGLALFVIGVFTVQSAAMGFVGQAARFAKATAVGLYVCSYYIGGSVGAVVPGLLVWRTAGWAGCVALVLVVLTAAAAVVWRTWREAPAFCAAE